MVDKFMEDRGNKVSVDTQIEGQIGELSVRWNSYLGQYIMMYLNDLDGRIEMRSSLNLWGPWSDPLTVATASNYPCLYAPFMLDGYEENNGQTIYFRMSRFCPGFEPYSTYWMKMNFAITS